MAKASVASKLALSAMEYISDQRPLAVDIFVLTLIESNARCYSVSGGGGTFIDTLQISDI